VTVVVGLDSHSLYISIDISTDIPHLSRCISSFKRVSVSAYAGTAIHIYRCIYSFVYLDAFASFNRVSNVSIRRYGYVHLWIYLKVCRSRYICLFYVFLCTHTRVRGPTCWIGIQVFLGRSHTNINHVFRLDNPVYDMDTYIFKVNVFTKQAKYE